MSSKKIAIAACLALGIPAAFAQTLTTMPHQPADPVVTPFLLTDGRVVLVDWPQAGIGAPWIDLLFMLPSVVMQGGPAPADVWRSSPLAGKADPDAVNSSLASLTGYLVHSSLLPPPLNLPKIREFQRVQGEHALAWLRSRL